MEDRAVLDAFVGQGVRRAFGPTLHVEGNALFVDGWWQAAYRVADDTFIVRDEEPPGDSPVLDLLAAVLGERDLRMVGRDFPAVTAITYTQITLGSASWAVWAPDAAQAEAAMAALVTGESFFDPNAPPAPPGVDLAETVASSPQLGGARRLAGLPVSLVVAVGIGPDEAEQLQEGLPDCRVSPMPLDAGPDACGTLIPTLVVVDATEQAGLEFIMEYRASACGRFTPIAGLTKGGTGVPLGADVALDRDGGPPAWLDSLRALLP